MFSSQRIFIDCNKLTTDSTEDAKQIVLSPTAKHFLQIACTYISSSSFYKNEF